MDIYPDELQELLSEFTDKLSAKFLVALPKECLNELIKEFLEVFSKNS